MTHRPDPAAVFVYGTLRPGHGNHAYLIAPRPHRSTAARLAGFRLVGRDNGFPYVVPDPDAVTVGDLVTFPRTEWPAALAALDGLEGYPSHYGRQVVDAALDDGRTFPAWVYVPADVARADRLADVPGGDWTAWTAERFYARGVGR